MATKRPLALYNGAAEELRSGDTVAGADVADVRAPDAVFPLATSGDVVLPVTLQAGSFSPLYHVDQREARQFEVDVPAGDFSAPIRYAALDADQWLVDPALEAETGYKWRCRDKTTRDTFSPWMTVQAFATGVAPPDIYCQGSVDASGAIYGVQTSDMTVTGALFDDHQVNATPMIWGNDGFLYASQAYGDIPLDNTPIKINPADMTRTAYYTSELITGGRDLGGFAWGEDGYLYACGFDNIFDVAAVHKIDSNFQKVDQFLSSLTWPTRISRAVWGMDGFLYAMRNGSGSIFKLQPWDMTESGSALATEDSWEIRAAAWGGDGSLYVGTGASFNQKGRIHKIAPADMIITSTWFTDIEGDRVTSMIWGGDGFLYVGVWGNDIYKIDPADFTISATFSGHTEPVFALAWGADGYLYSGGSPTDQTVRKIDPFDMTQVGDALAQYSDAGLAVRGAPIGTTAGIFT